jgi:MAPEG family
MPVTAFYASILTVLAFVLAQHVIKTRGRTTIALGDRGDDRLLEASRRQMNFVENVPLTLILLLLAETGGAAQLQLHIAGTVLVCAPCPPVRYHRRPRRPSLADHRGRHHQPRATRAYRASCDAAFRLIRHIAPKPGKDSSCNTWP